jgi:hypothetical protein
MANKRGERYTKFQTEACRAKIQTSLLVKRLTDNAMGLIELNPTQVRSIEILLNKSLANLSQVEQVGEVAQFVVRVPTPAPDAAAWSASLSPTEGKDEDNTKH